MYITVYLSFNLFPLYCLSVDTELFCCIKMTPIFSSFSVGTKRARFRADGQISNSEDGWRELSERGFPWWQRPLQPSLQAHCIHNTTRYCQPANSLPVDTEQLSRGRDLHQRQCKNLILTILSWISWLQITTGSFSRRTKVLQPLSRHVTYSRSLDTLFQNLMLKTKPPVQKPWNKYNMKTIDNIWPENRSKNTSSM